MEDGTDMDILDNEVNKRLISGNFPSEILQIVDEYKVDSVDFSVLAEPGVKVLREYPMINYSLFTAFANRVKEIELLNKTELFEQEANILINTGYTVDTLSGDRKIYLEGSKLCPAVTTVDKILWYGEDTVVWSMYLLFHQ